MDSLTSQGIEAFRNGDIEQARALFRQAVQANPRNEDALLWLSQLAESDAERAEHLRRVLDVNPNNSTARRGLAAIEGRPAPPAPAGKGRAPVTGKTKVAPRRKARRASLSLGQRLIGWALGHLRLTIGIAGLAMAAIAILLIVNAARNRPAEATREPAPTRAPLDNQIAFVSDRSGAPELYVGRADGAGNLIRLTFDDNVESEPAWSPNRKLIAYKVATADDRADLYAIDPNQLGPKLVAKSIAVDQSVVWSPDGDRVAYVADLNGNLDLFTQPVPGDAAGRVNISHSSANDYQPQWSPDGKQIAFVSDRDGPPAIYIASADGSNPKRLIEDDTTQSDPAWSPDGRYIAYGSSCRGDTGVSVAKAEGSAAARVAWTDAPAGALAWSPDSGAILYQSGSGTYLATLDGRRPTRIAEPARYASWSPDGQRIAFSALDGSQFDIVTARVDGSEQATFRADPRQDTWPVWQPAVNRESLAPRPIALTFAPIAEQCVPRDRIVYAAEHNGNTDIFVLREGDRVAARLTDDPAIDRSPVWSPDRRSIAFVSNRNGNFDIFLLDVDNGSLRVLTRDKVDEDHPAWSPDGQLIGYQTTRDGASAIDVVGINGVGRRRVAQLDGQTDPAWSPDGRQIAFALGGDIYRVNLDGSNAVNLTLTPAEDSSPAWSPDGKGVAFVSIDPKTREPHIYIVALDGSKPQFLIDESAAHPAWSPDGRRILYVIGSFGSRQIVSFDLKLHKRAVLATERGADVSAAWPPAQFEPALVVSAIPSPTPTPTASATPSQTPRRSSTPTPTRTQSPTATATTSRTPTSTRTGRPSPAATVLPTSTPSRTPIRTVAPVSSP